MMRISIAMLLLSLAAPTAAHGSDVWRFSRLDRVAGVKTEVEGNPTIISSPLGKAVQFDGIDDALFIPRHPLAGARTFTFEAVFRPDGGAFEQRWFHLSQDVPPQLAGSQNPRMLFEIRVVDKDKWYLDAFAKGPGYNQALMFPAKLHKTGCWYHVAQVYDGTTYRSYVNGVLQGEARIQFKPQGAGRSSVGVRLNRVNYFNGAVRQARFTHRALTPAQFRMPAKRKLSCPA